MKLLWFWYSKLDKVQISNCKVIIRINSKPEANEP